MDHFHSHLKLPEDRAYRIDGSVENTACRGAASMLEALVGERWI